jgi:hypothetical protein
MTRLDEIEARLKQHPRYTGRSAAGSAAVDMADLLVIARAAEMVVDGWRQGIVGAESTRRRDALRAALEASDD